MTVDLKRLRLDHPIDCSHRHEMAFFSHLHLPLKCGICLDLEELAADHQARFVLGNVSDGHGTLVLSELEGSRFYESPHHDRLAPGGMRFTQGYAACQVATTPPPAS